MPGSYRCVCPYGYKLAPDNKHCIGIEGGRNKKIVCLGDMSPKILPPLPPQPHQYSIEPVLRGVFRNQNGGGKTGILGGGKIISHTANFFAPPPFPFSLFLLFFFPSFKILGGDNFPKNLGGTCPLCPSPLNTPLFFLRPP